ncbi:MAG: VWA domain-containing protein [Caryophanon sp.]|nr:VWA domain-containing protein [Caryophanon sp.]
MYEQSVLHIEQLEMDRFNQLLQMAKVFQQVCYEGTKLHPQFTNIIGDLWAAFYKQDVMFQEDIPPQRETAKQIVTSLIESESYVARHAITIGDDLLSVLCAMAMSEALKKWLEQNNVEHQREENKRNAEYAENQVKEARRQMYDPKATEQEKERARTRKQFAERRLADLKKREERLRNEQSKTLDDLPSEQLQNMLEQAHENAQQTAKNVGQLAGDEGRAALMKVPLREQLALAEKVRYHPNLQEIADLAGRFRRIAKKKQKQKFKRTMERRNITLGREVERLLPMELANWSMPSSKLDFLRRYSEQQTFIFSTRGKDKRGKGPIIICMDESSSMSMMRAKSKAFCLALMMIAKKQKRDLAVVPFATTVGDVTLFKRGMSTTNQLIHFCDQFLNGGTNFERPLDAALTILNESRFQEADIVFVTDGASTLSESFLKQFQETKKRKQFQCLSVVLSTKYTKADAQAVECFSDKVLEVSDLAEAEDVFELGI